MTASAGEFRVDFVKSLADLNQYIVVETIVQHAGYEATVNMLCVSKVGFYRRRRHRSISELFFLFLLLLQKPFSFWSTSDIITKYPAVEPTPTV